MKTRAREKTQAKRAPHVSRGKALSRRIAGAALAVGLVALFAIAWPLLHRGAVRRESGLNVLLVTIDTLRADALGCYGRSGDTSPLIDRLAGEGVLFEHAHAHNVLTLPSHVNILTGRLPFDHGVRDNAGFRLAGDVDTLATRLRALGYRTGAFVSGAPLQSRFGLARGFDVYDDRFADQVTPEKFAVAERPAVETIGAALEWLGESRARPWFLWVHVYDPHAPYRPPEPFASRFGEEPYLGEVAATDAALRPLLEPMLDLGRDGRTLVVLTGDHGEALGDHGELTHGLFAYESTLRIPLVLYAPRLLPARGVSAAASHVDLVPTVLDALDLEVPADLPGRSLLPLAAGRPPATPPVTYFEALSGQIVRGWAPLYGVLRDGVKYVDLPIPELYDLREDPGETHNLAGRRPEDLVALAAALDRFRGRETTSGRVHEDAETMRRLAALGYVGGGSVPVKAEYTDEDDPKNLVELDTMLQRVLTLHREERLDEALALCRELVERRPSMAVSHAQLATLYSDLGRREEAIAAAREALALNPTDVMPAVLLARDLVAMERPREAVELLQPYAARDEADYEVLTGLGEALARVGDAEGALDALSRALTIDPSDAMTLVKMAAVHVTSGDLESARRSLERALTIDPDLALAHDQLGTLAAARGDVAEAERRFRRALESNPDEADALLNLGMLLARQDRRDEARPLLERFVRVAPRPLFDRQVDRVREWLRRVPAASARPSEAAPGARGAEGRTGPS